MKHHTPWNTIAGSMLESLLASLLMATSVAQASEIEPGFEPIDTVLAVPSDPVEYPDPICLGCKIVTKRPTASAGTHDDHGVLEITYEGVLGVEFMGDLVVTVFLPGTGASHVVVLHGVSLVDGQTTALELPSGGADWSWQDVGTVMVRMNEQS